MKKEVLVTIIGWLMMPMMIFGQTYSSLWKKVEEAGNKDLPKSQYEVLQKIVGKATKEKAYGQLLKAELQAAQVMQCIAPDSIIPAVAAIQKRCDGLQDPVLKTVYQTVLWRVWNENPRLSEEDEEGNVQEKPAKPVLTQELCQQLAQVKEEDYTPFVVKGSDSKFFGHDLLSIIGYELESYEPLHTYYKSVGNRQAACLTGLQMLCHEKFAYDNTTQIRQLDSLIRCYEDLPEAGEIAIERYHCLERASGTTAEEKVNYIHEALGKWDSWQRMNILRNAERRLIQSQFQASCDKRVITPMTAQEVALKNLRNLKSLKLEVYPLKAKGNIDLNPDYARDYEKIKKLMGPVVQTVECTYTGKQPYDIFEDSLTIEGLPVGVYLLEFSTNPGTAVSRCLYFVTDVYTLEESQPNAKTRYVVVRASTGQPIPKAHLTIRQRVSYNNYKTHEVVTDNKGEYFFEHKNNNNSCEVFAYTDTDQACPELHQYNRFYYDEGKKESRQTVIFTDRAIYRPGQTVHVSAIVYDVKHGIDHEAVANQSVRLTLRDANNKVVKEQQVQTDAYGTCATDFTLPGSGLTGTFTIQSNSVWHRFRVEEYKRPTFEVNFPEVTQHYEAGDTVKVKGTAKSYAGVPVQGARVSYRVIRRTAFWWWTYCRYYSGGFIGTASEETEICTGETVTESDGGFTVEMPMTMPQTEHAMFYQFVATADVTDQAGETHSGQVILPLGNRKTALSVDLEEKVLIEAQPTMTFHLRNAAGNDIEASVKYSVDGGKWLTAKTKETISIAKVQSKSGKHTVEAVCGKDTIRRDFVIFSLDDKRPAVETDDWFYVSADQFPNDGKPVTLQVGSSAEDVYIVYSLFAGDKVIEQGAVNQSNALINRKFTYQEAWGDGLFCTFAWVKNGHCYTHTQTIQRPMPDKHLQLQWKTFRDRLTPGQQEEWTLSVTKDGQPVDAMLMATMYDKSLEQLAAHRWNFWPVTYLSTPYVTWTHLSQMSLYERGSAALTTSTVRDLVFSQFDDAVFPSPYRSRRIIVGYGRGLSKGMAVLEDAPMMVGAARSASNNAVMDADEAVVMKAKETVEEAEEPVQPETQTQEVQMRENLNETAFFYPQLATDAEGRVVLKFTLPESLTTWRFMGLAHTKKMDYGSLSGEAIAKKDVMIQPNMPRFIREGDEAVISARIFNTAEKDVKGTATLRLLNPETDEVVYETSQPFETKVDGTTAISFQFQSTLLNSFSPSLLICQVLATGEGFSDGEQHYLPVLPSTERVTVTRPFTQIEPGMMTIDLRSLFPSADKEPVKDSKLTIEYTNNPAWLMIQALPAIGKPIDDNAISQTASFYANSIGKFIVDQNPKIQSVFKLWQDERLRVGELCSGMRLRVGDGTSGMKGDETSLMSALEKNQELKNLVLNETPWVLDADRESEQKQRLADFFDENTMQMRLSSALSKMKALQRSDGSWSWWPDMPGSFYMTVEISEMLVRLNHLTGQQQSTSDMLSKAFKFMGREIVEEVKEMKKWEKKGHKPTFPSFKALQWLYMCALDGRSLPSSVQAANDYLMPLLKKDIKSQSIYEKAMTAVILARYPALKDKDRQKALEYVQSLKEYTVYREDMGRYYDTPRAGYSWYSYKIPTQTMAVEALQNITPDDKQTILEMQRWLLQEKRTQSWDTPINSVNAVYAFLNTPSPQSLNSKLSTLNSKLSTLKVDNTTLDTSEATAGLGYIKQVVAPESKTLTIEKTSEGTSWGAVYAQFTQKTSDIEDASAGIRVKREILVNNNGQWLLVNGYCSVGDRLKVRLTIQCERDLDFVQVLDKRAACMEPVRQLSGYHDGAYCTPRDYTTNYYFNGLSKGRHVLETEYFIDRPGTYETGTCTVQCAYAPEFRATTHSSTIRVK